RGGTRQTGNRGIPLGRCDAKGSELTVTNRPDVAFCQELNATEGNGDVGGTSELNRPQLSSARSFAPVVAAAFLWAHGSAAGTKVRSPISAAFFRFSTVTL